MDLNNVLKTLQEKGWHFTLKTTDVIGCSFTMIGRNEKIKAGVFGIFGYGPTPEDAVKSFVEKAKSMILDQREEQNEESKVSTSAGNGEI